MDLSEWIKLQSPKVRNNVSIATHTQAYHISTDPKIRRFTPMIGNRMAKTEDRTIPRVCCNNTLTGCISGHAATICTSFDEWWRNKAQVFYIYEMPFTEYIKPNAKLVYDAEATGELWIVPNSPITTSFKAGVIGEFTMLGYTSNALKGKEYQCVIFIGRADKSIQLDDGASVNGYFKLELEIDFRYNQVQYNNVLSLKSHRAISRSDYEKELAELLNNVERTKGQ